MLSCIVGKSYINTLDYSEKELRSWAKRKLLKCPVCEQNLVYKHGMVRIPHFAHPKDCECTYTFYENETKEHHLSKVLIYKMLKDSSLFSNVQLESYIRETKQRPDLYFEYNGLRYVVECQCSPITPQEIKERTTLYKLNNIIDIWIFGTEKFNEYKPIACQDLLESYFIINPFENRLALRKQNGNKTYKVIDNIETLLYMYNNSYFSIESKLNRALKVNDIVNFLYNYLSLNDYSCISNNICNVLGNNNDLIIKVEPNDSNRETKNLKDYLSHIAFTGDNNVYLRGSDFYLLRDILRQNRKLHLPFRAINNRGNRIYL